MKAENKFEELSEPLREVRIERVGATRDRTAANIAEVPFWARWKGPIEEMWLAKRNRREQERKNG